MNGCLVHVKDGGGRKSLSKWPVGRLGSCGMKAGRRFQSVEQKGLSVSAPDFFANPGGVRSDQHSQGGQKIGGKKITVRCPTFCRPSIKREAGSTGFLAFGAGSATLGKI